jgi:hypothetical protein
LRSAALFVGTAAAVLCLSGAAFGRSTQATTEVVVTLEAPPLSAFGARNLASASRARQLAAAQAAVEHNVEAAIPASHVRWRYRTVLNGFAVVVPASEVDRLEHVPGVARVWPNVRYHALLDRSTRIIGADKLWGPGLDTAGNGIKIGIIDDGLDATHPFFSPAGFSYPAGFPKGQTALATPKVIVQRTFVPATPKWKYATRPFDPENSFHATHVAGIAAGDNGVEAAPGRALSGVAPRAQIGNYKALTIPTPNFGLDGNSAEIAAAIEAAVNDGMNVINLSLGEPEVEPSRDLVVRALAGAAAAGVVPVVAAGNDFDEFGFGSVGSPANAPAAITVAASTKIDGIAGFSSGGPTTVSLTMKPDVTAPGTEILSSLPVNRQVWGTLQGTSMAAPHVAGAAALLKQRHPSWTPAQIKSALVQTGSPVRTDSGAEALATRQGGGRVTLTRADAPLLFAAPTGLAFGMLRSGQSATRTIALTDAGGGAGQWSVSTVVQDRAATVTAPTVATVPGQVAVRAVAGASQGDVAGFVVLTRGADVRRVPFWLAVTQPRLAGSPRAALRRPGVYSGTTVRKPSRVTVYRYPVTSSYPGPESVYRVSIGRGAANFGVAVLSGRAVPHIVFGGDENHLAGYTALPLALNPYLSSYGTSRPISGAVLPASGPYDIVFESRSAAEAGPFTFRYWVNDTKPPALRVVGASGGRIVVAATDGGAGVDPASITVNVDGRSARTTFRNGRITIVAARGTHRLLVQASDYQESKNMEDVPKIRPNTAALTTTVRVR